MFHGSWQKVQDTCGSDSVVRSTASSMTIAMFVLVSLILAWACYGKAQTDAIHTVALQCN